MRACPWILTREVVSFLHLRARNRPPSRPTLPNPAPVVRPLLPALTPSLPPLCVSRTQK